MEPEIVTTIVERWLQRWRTPSEAPAPAPVVVTSAVPEVLSIEMAAALAPAFSAEYPLADAAATQVLAAVSGVDLSALARRSPGLKGYDWTAYLRCSIARVVRAHRALNQHVPPGGRVLDFGSYFGNFALAFVAGGLKVDAVDSYREYGAGLAPCVALQRQAGVTVHDFAELGYGLESLRGTFDAVVCAGVIEHIPHTPKPLLETLTLMLKPGGVLVLDTPNLAYLYRRLALMEGQTIFLPITQQYHTDLPFEGHHREYTVAEVQWMLEAAGHEVLSVETFNYSMFAQPTLEGEHLAYYRAMLADLTLRELIVTVSRPRPRSLS